MTSARPSRPRRVICHFSDTSGFGGAEAALLGLVEGLSSLGEEQIVVLHHHAPNALKDELQARNVPLQLVDAVPDGLSGVRRLPRFVGLLRRLSPMVFHAHLTMPLACKFPLLGAQLAGVPAIIATEQLMLEFPFGRSARYQQRLVARRVDRFVAVSDHVARSLAALGWPADKLTVIPNAIDVGRFAFGDERVARSHAAPIVLTVARLDNQKGHEYLIEAADALPEVRVLIAGDGPERARLEELARRSPASSRIEFLGARRDIPELLAGCDVFVLPSLFEGLPLAVLEAMAAGRPVVASDIGGIDEIVIPEMTGLLVPPRDAGALAAAVRRLLDDPGLGHRLGEQAHELVRSRYQQSRMARDVLDLYRAVTAPRGAPRP